MVREPERKRQGLSRAGGAVRTGAIALAAALVWALMAASLPLGATPAGAQSFLSGFEDVPLMEGMTADPDAGLVFDSPAGRIVEAWATGSVRWGEVLAFYAATLDSLGWVRETPSRFRREGEVLTIDKFGRDGDLTVRFTLGPDA